MLSVKFMVLASCFSLFTLLLISCSPVEPKIQHKNIRFSYTTLDHPLRVDLRIKIINHELNVVHGVKYDVLLSNNEDQEWLEYSKALDLLPGDSITLIHFYSNEWTEAHAYLDSF